MSGKSRNNHYWSDKKGKGTTKDDPDSVGSGTQKKKLSTGSAFNEEGLLDCKEALALKRNQMAETLWTRQLSPEAINTNGGNWVYVYSDSGKAVMNDADSVKKHLEDGGRSEEAQPTTPDQPRTPTPARIFMPMHSTGCRIASPDDSQEEASRKAHEDAIGGTKQERIAAYSRAKIAKKDADEEYTNAKLWMLEAEHERKTAFERKAKDHDAAKAGESLSEYRTRTEVELNKAAEYQEEKHAKLVEADIAMSELEAREDELKAELSEIARQRSKAREIET
jgi:hypothetical protein